MSCGIKWGACWDKGLASRPDLIDMWPVVSTLEGVAGDAFGVASGKNTIGGGAGVFYCGVDVLSGAVSQGETSMLKIDANCFNSAVCFYHIIGIGMVGVGLRRAWLRSAATCVAASSEEILGKGILSRNNSIVSDIISATVLRIHNVRQR